MEIYESEFYDLLFERLTECGYVPQQDELEIIADVFFEFLEEKGIIGDVIYLDEDEE